MLSFITFRFLRLPVESRRRLSMIYIKGRLFSCITQTQIRTHELLLSPHIIWHDFIISFLIVIKTLLHGFDPYITIYLRCKCAMFLGARTHRKARKCSIEICLYRDKERHLWIVIIWMETELKAEDSSKKPLLMYCDKNGHLRTWLVYNAGKT